MDDDNWKTKVYGPAVRFINPLRIRTKREADGSWTGSYGIGSLRCQVFGCSSKAEAKQEIRHLLKMRVAYRDGR